MVSARPDRTLSDNLCHRLRYAGDPARMALGPRASQEQVDDLKVKMGLNLPLAEQYERFVLDAAHADLCLSFLTKRSVNDD
jgi:peptide/nickel transport system permease protein